MSRHRATVIVRNRDGRYFYKFDKNGKALTSHTLAGAKFFHDDGHYPYVPHKAVKIMEKIWPLGERSNPATLTQRGWSFHEINSGLAE